MIKQIGQDHWPSSNLAGKICNLKEKSLWNCFDRFFPLYFENDELCRYNVYKYLNGMQCLLSSLAYILLVVTFHVIFQVSFLLCRIITKLTTKRFFSCMNHCMPFSTVMGIENHGTMLTAKLFGAQAKWNTLKTIKPCIKTKVYLKIWCRLQDNFS